MKHVYFVAETNGSMLSMELRAIEQSKIDRARKFFGGINQHIAPENVRYGVVDSFETLRMLVESEIPDAERFRRSAMTPNFRNTISFSSYRLTPV